MSGRRGRTASRGRPRRPGFSLKKESDTPGAGCFTLRFRRGKKQRPTGKLPAINTFRDLNEVFEAAREALTLVKKGINPIAARKREKAANLAAVSFKQAASRLITSTSRRR